MTVNEYFKCLIKLDSMPDWKKGYIFQDAVAEFWLNNGHKVKPATKTEDMTKHMDLHIDSYTHDVKAPKKVHRFMPYLPNIWVLELVNRNGDRGWVYGDEDYVTFTEFDENKYKMWAYDVNRILLEKYVDRLGLDVDNPIVVDSTDFRSLNEPYQRKGNKDVFVYVEKDDVLRNVSWVKYDISDNLLKILQ